MILKYFLVFVKIRNIPLFTSICLKEGQIEID